MPSIIACDPGTKSFWAAWLENDRVIGLKHVINTIDKLPTGPLQPHVLPFWQEFQAMLASAKPQVIVIERFQARRFGTLLSERIGLMIGILARVDPPVRIELTMASQWKRAVGKVTDYDALQAAAKELGFPPHPVDAILIGRWYLNGKMFRQGDDKWLLRELRRLARQRRKK